MTGTVVDFQSNTAVTAAPMVTTAGLLPVPMVTIKGAAFTLSGVPENSSFQIEASVSPTHRQTFSPAVEVTTSSLDNVNAYAVSETFLSGIAGGFGVTPSTSNGILLLHLVDANGAPKSGVAGSNIVLANSSGASGPHFLDANLAASTATTSSSSGWVVFFDVPPGTATLAQAANATATLSMATSPVIAAAVTIANVQVTDGAPPALPSNVSFSNQVFPIFSRRGCVNCHSGNGAGRDLGNLTLDGSTNLVYKELTGPEDPLRVVVSAPETSLVLTMPSYENPPDAHPNVTFTGPTDPDYETILVWIREGAKEN